MAIQKHNESKTTALTQYRPPSPESMGALLATLKGGYPNQSVTAETAELYLTEFSVIHREVGQQRLEVAIRESIRTNTFFPGIAEIRAHIPPLVKENETLNEMRELERRQAAGEKFYGFADVLRGVKERGVKPEVKPMPNVKTVWPDFDPMSEAKQDELKRKAKEVADALLRQERARASAGDRD